MESRFAGVQRELFRGLVENSVVGMVVIEEIAGRFFLIFANARALETLELNEIGGFQVENFFPSSEQAGAYTNFGRDILSRDGLTSEVMMQKANGHQFLASVSVKRVVLEERAIALLSFQDVTIEKKLSRDLHAKQLELERAYGELLEQNSQLKLLDQAKDKFIALTTHELRTPLAAILATADVLELKLYESEEQKEEFIRTISEQGRHLMALVNDILDFAKIRAGKMEFFIEPVDLKAVVRKLAGHFSHMAVRGNIGIHVAHIADVTAHAANDEGAAGPFFAWADLLRLKEVLNNVLSNAVKYNRANGSVMLSVIEFRRVDGRKFARIVVRDTGIGIPEDKWESVFNEFETVGHVDRHHKGTGLGMPISKRLIESMGGQLTLRSEVGVGSEFYIDVPTEKVLSEDHYRSRPGDDADLAA